MTEEDLRALEVQYGPYDPGVCRVCGAELDVQAIGPGSYTAWAHSTPEGVSMKEWGEHYSASRVESWKAVDSRVMALVAEVRRMREEYEN